MAQSEASFTITQEQLKGLEDAIRNAPIEGMGPKENFCTVWPSAKGGLEALRMILSFVPGVSVIAGPAISIVIAAGDAAKSALCK
ncbi:MULTISPECIES: hypothetical protein [Azospirillum]|uniref:Uncharacterized protein n=1 Tax=Azospirillum brasilense TaxID=192 RepID=A0A0P0EET0_AZOBR|nr:MULTISPECIES: hypothetical protein [Azospirillum]ALJ36341.1 hypothetical protein AMK58_13470 [Azospirillum brasilense]MDW7557795.1 hypothetical protein [Azospirillum brasilense]MDW7597429.1 hypothetical protein [Azospirillum brasilense]MDW7632692.1 hypothetical protein [Azospirillum brasilense]MDX5952435.1 hypothetical protein [Azospirillum brasilense]